MACRRRSSRPVDTGNISGRFACVRCAELFFDINIFFKGNILSSSLAENVVLCVLSTAIRSPNTETSLRLNHNFIQPTLNFFFPLLFLLLLPPPPLLHTLTHTHIGPPEGRPSPLILHFFRALARPTTASAPNPTFNIADIFCMLMINFFVCRVDRLGLSVSILPTPTHSNTLGLAIFKNNNNENGKKNSAYFRQTFQLVSRAFNAHPGRN